MNQIIVLKSELKPLTNIHQIYTVPNFSYIPN